MKKTLCLLAGLALAAQAMAQLSKYKDWAKSPEAYFLTPSEREEWGRIQADADGEKFIALYWAKRDPNPATANNEFRDEVSRRIAAADEQFKMRRQRGAESARGRMLVVLGAPSRFSQQRAQESDQTPSGVTAPSLPTGGVSASQQATVTWTYEKDKFDPSWGIGDLRARVLVDPEAGFDQLQTAGVVDRAIAKVAEKSIVNPGAQVGAAAPVAPPSTGAPSTGAPPAPAASTATSPVAPAVPPAATGAPAAAPAVPDPSAPAPSGAAAAPAALPAANRAALQTILQGRKTDESGFWAGAFRSIPGEPFYALQLYVPGDKVEAAGAAGVKFGGVVQSGTGQEVAVFWEDASLTEMKTGARTDRVYERSIVLPPGSYRGSFGLFPATGGEAIVSSSAQWTIPHPSGDFGVSPLILGNTLTPLSRRPAPTDPFVFGAEKPIKVEPKANKQFTRDDGLWYFYTVSNPTLAESAPAASPTPAPAATPAPSTTPGAATAPAPKPRVQTRISVLRDGKNAFEPFTGPAAMQPLGTDYYASGSEIPLASFEPGHYTFALLVRDLNAPRDSPANKGIERREEFIVLMPDGKVPPKAAAAAPAAKPKPTPRKP